MASNNEDQNHGPAFGCGSIDIKGGGTGDPGGAAGFIPLIFVPILVRVWRLMHSLFNREVRDSRSA